MDWKLRGAMGKTVRRRVNVKGKDLTPENVGGDMVTEKRFVRQLAAILIMVTSLLPGLTRASDTFATGDVFVSVSNGKVQWRHSDGTLNSGKFQDRCRIDCSREIL